MSRAGLEVQDPPYVAEKFLLPATGYRLPAKSYQLTISVLPRQFLVAPGLLEMVRRRQIRHIGRERDSFDPAERLEQLPVLRILPGKHALEDVGGDVVDHRLLKMHERHVPDLLVTLDEAQRHVVRTARDSESTVLLDPPIAKQGLRTLPVHLHRCIRKSGRRVGCRIEHNALGNVPE